MIMKKSDIALLLLFLVLTIAMTGYVIKDKLDAKAGALVVYSEGKVVKRLNWPPKDQTFRVKNDLGYIDVVVKSGKVTVADADCHDKICVHTKAISQGGEMIVCLPHKMYVEVQKANNDENAIDGFSQ